MFGYEIDWTAVGVCLTGLIAVWKLREDSSQKARDRELETKREILFDGVRGMSQAVQAFSGLANLGVPFTDSMKSFQAGMSYITVSTSVASLPTAKAGKEFIDTLGPLFLEAMSMRTKIGDLPEAAHSPDFRRAHHDLATFILDHTIELGKSMLRAIASVRSDVGIAKESEQQFLAVVYPNEELLKPVIDKTLGRNH